MKTPLNDIIPLLHLQEFMSLTFVQGKLCASTSCFIFYIDSLHATWTLYKVSPKLLYLSICIALMVVLMPTILWVNTSLSLISTSALSVHSFNVVMGRSPT
ncbi:hypothetical protein GW17_00061845 [Ensete ventricosum]|nr:hypothetical protein GW17_00061845 [Ensete ventricosum]RZS28527.1 hypothetical protein BHM03_00062127 [Ensete ventricosum]